jgi:hypothetical protein
LSDKRKPAGWRKSISNLLIFVGTICVLVGGLFTYRAVQDANYIPAIGRSLSAEIRKETTRLSGDVSSSKEWKLYVEYEYWIGGEYFTSDAIGSSRPSSDASDDQLPSPELLALRDRYKAGNRIEVYVSPSKPEQAILIRLGFGGVWAVLAGLIALCAAAAVRKRWI